MLGARFLSLHDLPEFKGRVGTAPADIQSEFGDGYKARFVGPQGLPEFKGRSGTAPTDLQSAGGDGYGLAS